MGQKAFLICIMNKRALGINILRGQGNCLLLRKRCSLNGIIVRHGLKEFIVYADIYCRFRMNEKSCMDADICVEM